MFWLFLSLEWLQTELDSTRCNYQLIIKFTISEERRLVKSWKKEKICIKRLTKEALIVPMMIKTQVVIGWIKL